LQLLFVAVVASSMPHFAVGCNIVVQRVCGQLSLSQQLF